MSRFSIYTFVAVFLGVIGLASNSQIAAAPEQGVEVRMAADGAFEDGLYLGRLAVQGGQPSHPGVGRWAADRDRAVFLQGYLQGYESVARKRR